MTNAIMYAKLLLHKTNVNAKVNAKNTQKLHNLKNNGQRRHAWNPKST